MTFITGPSLTTKTTPIIDSKVQEHVVELCDVHSPPRGRAGPPPPPAARTWLLLTATMLSLMAALYVLVFFMPTRPERPSRYHGYCTIPIKEDFEGSSLVSMHVRPAYNVMPLRWSQDDADVQVFHSGGPGEEAEELVKTLRERFDIGDQVEKISVMDNGKRVNFIHDFELNTTDIVDEERCFTSELDREAVLAPPLLLLSIQQGGALDVSRARAALAAALPALAARALPAALQDACAGKPVYRLLRQEVNIIRKRSVDAPAHDYIQFSGRGVQEIVISNLADILQHEQDAAAAAAAPAAAQR